jgi:plasmid stability protein
MPTITVRNIPVELYDRLRRSAEVNRRSINSEIIICLEQALHSGKIDPEAVVTRARKLREKTIDYAITDAEFTEAKSAGRK